MESNLNRLFSQAYFIGGSPCSGKSTIAEMISRQYQLEYYKVDEYEGEHMQRCHPDIHPVMHKYSKMDWNEIWMRPVQVQVKEEFEFYRERFQMIRQDLNGRDPERCMIIEGAALLPELLSQYGADHSRVVFMVPTKDFQIHHYWKRGWIKTILKDCVNPRQAFENWMERDYGFGQVILRQAKNFGFNSILVDRSITKVECFDQVRVCLGFNSIT
ncbi:MAG: zeta toxin family protein [Anaerolineales bacterium]|nr:zeta toxin family protein [Anaerolineales bacterium]